jgi:hypothetical protein
MFFYLVNWDMLSKMAADMLSKMDEDFHENFFIISDAVDFFNRFLNEFHNTKCHENPSYGCRGVPRGWTDRQTDMTELLLLGRHCKVARN